MKTKITFIKSFILLFAMGLTANSSMAQTSVQKIETEESNKKTAIRKTVEVENLNGEKVVTVTTIEGNNKNVEVFTGNEAEEYLSKSHSKTMKMHVSTGSNSNHDGEAVQKSIIVIKTDGENAHSEDMVWISDDGDAENIEDIDITVTSGENGYPSVVTMVFVNEDGEKSERTIEIDEEEITKSIEELEKTLEDMNIHIEMDLSGESDKEHVKIIKISKGMEIEENQEMGEHESNLFESFSLTVNSDDNLVKIAFTPKKKGKTNVTISDQDGVKLHSESYSGKGEFSKKITVPQDSRILIIKIEQGNEIEIRKLKLD